jgi:hypothetical protein
MFLLPGSGDASASLYGQHYLEQGTPKTLSPADPVASPSHAGPSQRAQRSGHLVLMVRAIRWGTSLPHQGPVGQSAGGSRLRVAIGKLFTVGSK